MLTLEPALERSLGPRARHGGVALALAGGGPLGAFYEMGALHALSEAIEGFDPTRLDVYVGVSSGAMVAAGLANGFDTTTLGAIFIHDESTLFPFSPGILLRPAFAEYAQRAARLPHALAEALRQYARDPLRNVWSATVGALGRAVPTALFDNEPMERFLAQLLHSPGHTDDFRRLPCRLFVVATDLDTGESVRFGEPGRDHVPISRAVLASTALPGLYPPVRIGGHAYVDGALIRTMNASLALEQDCKLVVCINPLVPYDAGRARSGRHADVRSEGLAAVMSQTFRALIYSRMKVGMASYRSRFPDADLLLFEPDRHDERLFFVNVFRYADRRRLVEHAYQATRQDLRRNAAALDPLLRRHGLRLRAPVLEDESRTFATAAAERAEAIRALPQRLDRALRRLERLVAAMRKT